MVMSVTGDSGRIGSLCARLVITPNTPDTMHGDDDYRDG